MKKILLSIFILSSSLLFAQTTIYNGNGKSDFGGAVGKGTLSIMNTPDSFGIYLNKFANASFDSVMVFYIDTFSTSGITSTSQLIPFGNPDKFSKAVAAQSTPQSPTLTFPSNFTPDFAIAFDKNGGKIYSFQYAYIGYGSLEANSFTITPSGNSYGKSFSKADLGLTPGQPLHLNFIGTYIDGNTVSRSAEGFGDPFTGYNGTAKVESSAPYAIKTFFTYNSTTTLPIVLTNFKASAAKDKVQLTWSVAQETGVDGYELQRSVNGIQFSTIATISARNNSSATSDYSFLDNAPLKGTNYYRLVLDEKAHKTLSSVVSVRTMGGTKGFKIQQLGRILNLQLNNLTAGSYKLLIVNAAGQIVHTSNLQIDGDNLSKQVELQGSLSKGIYSVTLKSDTESLAQRVMLQ